MHISNIYSELPDFPEVFPLNLFLWPNSLVIFTEGWAVQGQSEASGLSHECKSQLRGWGEPYSLTAPQPE